MRHKKGLWRRISQGTPEEFITTTLRASDIFNATNKFFEDNFRGAVITEGELLTDGYTEASPDGIAYFFKVLLNAVFGDSVVRVKMACEKDIFNISTEWEFCREITKSDLAELENVARLSGFTLEFSNNGNIYRADIAMKLKALSYIPLYAISRENMLLAYNRVFFLT